MIVVTAARNGCVMLICPSCTDERHVLYCLDAVSLEIPSLRERAEDIPDMVGSFIRHSRGAVGSSVARVPAR